MRLNEMTDWETEQYFSGKRHSDSDHRMPESHGSHNVLGVDTLIPEKLLSMIEERTEVIAAPGIPYGVCEDMTSFQERFPLERTACICF